jgi:hypothetical protein
MPGPDQAAAWRHARKAVCLVANIDSVKENRPDDGAAELTDPSRPLSWRQ